MYLTKRFFYALLLLSFSVLVSCQDDEEAVPETSIVGSWRLVGGEYTFNDLSLRDYYKQVFAQAGITLEDSDLDPIVNLLEQSFDEEFDNGTVLEFQEDGSYTSSDSDGSESGTWEIRSNNQLIITSGAPTINFTINTLTGSELRLLVEEEDTVDLSDIGLSTAEPVTVGITLIFSKQ